MSYQKKAWLRRCQPSLVEWQQQDLKTCFWVLWLKRLCTPMDIRCVSRDNRPQGLCHCHTQRRIGGLGPCGKCPRSFINTNVTLQWLTAPSSDHIWVWHRLQNIIYEGSRVIFYSRCRTQRRIGGAPARQSFFGYDNDKDFKVCFLVTHVIRFSAIQLHALSHRQIFIQGTIFSFHDTGSKNVYVMRRCLFLKDP